MRCVLLAALAVAVASRASSQSARTQAVQSLRSVDDLPLDEVAAKGDSRLFAVFFTGDGNFAALDKGVAAELTNRGIPVVAFNQRTYLWSAKSPAQTGADLARILAWYRATWRRDSVVIIGYSRGAGTAPFAMNRLPADVRGMVAAVALIGPERTAGLKFRWRDLVSTTPAPDELPLMPELTKLTGSPLLCFYGSEEKDSPCPELAPPALRVQMTGGHYFEHEYQRIGQRIAAFVLGDRQK